MASNEDPLEEEIKIEEFPINTNYIKPTRKSVKEILETDQNDESLNKYKDKLLAGNKNGEVIVVDENNPLNVIIKKLSVIVDGKEMCTVNLPASEEYTLTIKEGSHYKIQFEFIVQREIVSGLKYLHKVSRHGIGVTKEIYMLGSYSPKKDEYIYTSTVEEAPTGFLSRGNYRVRSLITDDDEHRWLEWVWNIKIAKEW